MPGCTLQKKSYDPAGTWSTPCTAAAPGAVAGELGDGAAHVVRRVVDAARPVRDDEAVGEAEHADRGVDGVARHAYPRPGERLGTARAEYERPLREEHPVARVERVEEPAEVDRVEDAVRERDGRTPVHAVSDRPEPAVAASLRRNRPHIPRDRDRAVDGLAVVRGRAQDPSDRAGRPDERGPDRLHGPGVDHVVDARLLAVADEQPAASAPEEVRRRAEVLVDLRARPAALRVVRRRVSGEVGAGQLALLREVGVDGPLVGADDLAEAAAPPGYV